ncbi:MAG TPA: hypothetical protein ENK67_02025 [Flavobacteriia bacterium]|nr:hypothetical protein [Flavobacteriia bacterium]
MHTEKYITLLKNPQSISKKQTELLQKVIEVFPYFQSAKAIYLKGLKKQNSFLYNQALKKTAAYTSDRTVLFNLITSSLLNANQNIKNSSEGLLDIKVIDFKTINQQQEVFDSKDSDIDAPIKEVNEILEIGKPIRFKKSDSYSFNQWLQLSNEIVQNSKNKEQDGLENKNEREEKHPSIKEKEKKQLKNKQNKLDLIENFLQKKPKIKPVKKTEIPDISIDSIKPDTNLMTETLARVYIEQKKFDKAIQAFRILSLKYPEKSSFFANQIKAIEFLKNN